MMISGRVLRKYFLVFSVFFVWYELTDSSGVAWCNDQRQKSVPKLVCCLYSGDWGNVAIDGSYKGWDKGSGEFWDSRKKKLAPYEISSVLFPKLGVYSSHDESVVQTHFSMMRQAGIDSVFLLWNGQNNTDNGFTDATLRVMMKNAKDYGLKVGIQITKYEGMTSDSLKNDIMYYVDTYGSHESTLKIEEKPAIIIYEPFYIPHAYRVVQELRNTKFDSFFISTFLSNEQIGSLLEDGFDAVFTFFACPNLSPSSWNITKKICDERGMGLLVAVSPGYDNHLLQSWNRGQKRDNAEYYDNMWKSAIDSGARIIVVNSFNNWLESTNIEPALNKKGFDFDSAKWHSTDKDPYLYIKKTKEWADVFHDIRK